MLTKYMYMKYGDQYFLYLSLREREISVLHKAEIAVPLSLNTCIVVPAIEDRPFSKIWS